MPTADFRPASLADLSRIIGEALSLADRLDLPEVGVRLEQARLLLHTPNGER